MVSRIYLLRHGETEWTISGRHTGTTDIPLTPQGEEEARAVGQALQGIAFNRVLTSPRQRARRTCELAGLGAVAQTHDDLREWNYGEYEGLLPGEIAARHPGWNVFEHGCPGGESPEQAADRARRLLETVQTMEGNVALFSHGHFTRALAVSWARLQIVNGKIFGSSTGSISVLGFNGNGFKPVIELWNRTPRLR